MASNTRAVGAATARLGLGQQHQHAVRRAPTNILSMSSLFIPMQKETPADCILPGHQLLVRAGLIRKAESGVYTLLPLALRSLAKIEAIVVDEMNSIGGQRLHIPCLSGSDLWKSSGRWDKCGQEIFKFSDRKGSEFCLAPTCEEAITTLVASDVKSYKALPLRLYQINMKFRDEIRPRFGLLRCREFVMKDMYSFDETEEKAVSTYHDVSNAYFRIFERIGVPVRSVLADTGNIGGNLSHEFHIVSDNGEDSLLSCTSCGYGANEERAVSHAPNDCHETVSHYYTTSPRMTAATPENSFSVVVPKGRRPNLHLMERELGGACRSLDDSEEYLKSLPIKSFVDHSCTTSHECQQHHVKVAMAGDVCAECGSGNLQASRGIEVGHIFHLGTKYADTFDATFTDAAGRLEPFNMGCYGLGITRILQAVIESSASVNHQGIRWPMSIAPYKVAVISNGATNCNAEAESLYHRFQSFPKLAGEAVIDFRDDASLGVKFKQADLIGFPFKVVVGRDAAQGLAEVQHGGQAMKMPFNDVAAYVESKIP